MRTRLAQQITTTAAAALLACLSASSHAQTQSTTPENCTRVNGMLSCYPTDKLAGEKKDSKATTEEKAADDKAPEGKTALPTYSKSQLPSHGVTFNGKGYAAATGIKVTGVLTGTYCSGTTLMNKYSDGTANIAEKNSTKCGYKTPGGGDGWGPGYNCIGNTLYLVSSDGSSVIVDTNAYCGLGSTGTNRW